MWEHGKRGREGEGEGVRDRRNDRAGHEAGQKGKF